MPGIECFSAVVVKQGFGDVVDEFIRLLGARHPLRSDCQSLGLTDILVGIGRNSILREERVFLKNLLRFRTGNRNQRYTVRCGQFGDCTGRIAANEEIGIERAVLQTLSCRSRLQMFSLDVAFAQSIRFQHDAGINDRTRSRFIDGNALSLEIGNGFDSCILAGDQMNGFGVERSNQAQIFDLALAVIKTGAGMRPVSHVRLGEAGFQRSGLNSVDIGDRTVR